MTEETWDDLLGDVADTFGMSPDQVLSKTKDPFTVEARFIVSWCLRQHGLSYPRIGERTGRDHSTAMHAVKAVEKKPGTKRLAEQVLRRHPPRLGRVA